MNIKKKFQIVSGGCLIDSAYKCKSDLTLSKSEYDAALAKHYLLTQLLRFFGWLSALDIARKDKEGKMTKDPDRINPIDLKKEAAGMLYRSSQKNWGVKQISETTVHGIGCLKMRLDHRTGRNIFGTTNIPVINSKDPLSAKIIRNAHLANREGLGVIHNLTQDH